jgi:hypothetical protein
MNSFFSFTISSLFIFGVSTHYQDAHAARIIDKTYTIQGTDDISCGGLIGVVGTIEKGDTNKLQNFLIDLKKKCSSLGVTKVMFHSKGGDVDEAIKMGLLIRSNELWTEIDSAYNCFSACILAFSGGVVRDAHGKMGVHRPYFSALEANLSIKDIKNKRNEMSIFIKNYLNEMDINESLLDEMMATPPEEMKILSPEELKYYRIQGIDANWDERNVAMLANLYGTNSATIRQRKVIADNCKLSSGNSVEIQRWIDCSTAAYWGIPLKVYNDRSNKISLLCKNASNDEFKKCRVQVMTGQKK